MKKVFYLNSCDTCRKILAKFDLRGWEMREIKKEPITQDISTLEDPSIVEKIQNLIEF